MNGYNGRILRVNLSDGAISVDEPDESFYRRYLGGSGFISYFLLKELPRGSNALGPENKLIFATGPIIGVPSEKWGEEVKAIVVPRQGMSVTPEDIIEYCRDKISGFKRPKSAEIWKELPKTPSGKILKREVRQRYWAGEKRIV
jgi:acyl-CoA synthetase (AMP-forming)/AMP-acid ligase II